MNNSLIHADIFFFVTTICIAVLTILGIIMWIYGMKIMSNIRYISEQARLWSDKAKVEADLFLGEIQTIRRNVRRSRFNITNFFRLFRAVLFGFS